MINQCRKLLRHIKNNGLHKTAAVVFDRVGRVTAFVADKLLQNVLGQRYIHWRSRRYWANADNTYRGSDDYYARQEAALHEVLAIVDGERRTAVDVGCGDGRFTRVIADSYGSVQGVDISRALVDKASITHGDRTNLSFRHMDLTSDYPAGKFDLVSCMGVTSAIVAEDSFKRLLMNLAGSLNVGGYLITKDSLSQGKTWTKLNGSYVAIYRNEQEYIANFKKLGLTLEHSVQLAIAKKADAINRIFLWRLSKLGATSSPSRPSNRTEAEHVEQ